MFFCPKYYSLFINKFAHLLIAKYWRKIIFLS